MATNGFGAYLVTMQDHVDGNIIVCRASQVLTNGWTPKRITFLTPNVGTGFKRNRGIVASLDNVIVTSDSDSPNTEYATTVGGQLTNWSHSTVNYNLVPTYVANTSSELDYASAHRWLFNNQLRLLIIPHDNGDLQATNYGFWLETAHSSGVFYESLTRIHPLDENAYAKTIKYNYVNTSKQFVVGTTNYEYITNSTAGVSDWYPDVLDQSYVFGYNSPFFDDYLKWTSTHLDLNGTTYALLTIGITGGISTATFNSTNSQEVVVVSADVSNPIMSITTNGGATWTNTPFPDTAVIVTRICHGNGIYVALGTIDELNIEHSMVSTDGINWNVHYDVFGNVSFQHALVINHNSFTFGNGIFVAVGHTNSSGGRIFTSTDGVTWTERFIGHYTQSTYSDFRIHSVVFGNGLFVANTETGLTITSRNGINWQPVNYADKRNKPMDEMTEIAYIHRYGYFIGAFDSQLLFSFDGIVWNDFRKGDIRTSSAFGGFLTYTVSDIYDFGGVITVVFPASGSGTSTKSGSVNCNTATADPMIGWTRRQIPNTTHSVNFQADELVRQYAWLERDWAVV